MLYTLLLLNNGIVNSITMCRWVGGAYLRSHMNKCHVMVPLASACDYLKYVAMLVYHSHTRVCGVRLTNHVM